MNKTRVISNESLHDHNESNYTFLPSKNLNKFDINFNGSFSDIYETISLYDYDNDNEKKSSKRLTWEEWYLKKKIDTLKNEKNLQAEMCKKMNVNKKYGVLTEEQKKEKLLDWLEKKRKQKKSLEEKLKQVQEETEKRKQKKEAEKKKAEEKYAEWLNEVKKRELAEKEKKLEEERREKQKIEQEKLKKAEAEKRLKENKKEYINVRPVSSKKGIAIVNGKPRAFFDWSTSPDPSFVNKVEWQN